MKQLSIITLAIAIALVALMFAPGAAFADNPPHGGFNATADGCAGCHRAHTAAAPKLLINTGYALCMTCHGVTSGGSALNAKDGLNVGATPGSLLGGGFTNAKMNHDWLAAPAAGTATTSRHGVVGDGSFTTGTIWGNGAISATANPGLANFALECTSCHDPHGKAGASAAPTYRLLRAIPTGSGATAPGVTVADPATKAYNVTDATLKYYGQAYTDMAALSNWCGQCHTRIHTGAAAAPYANSSGDAIFTYRHPTNGTAVNINYPSTAWANSQVPGCLSCHVAHGTTATMSTQSAAVLQPGGGAAIGSALLRVDNRGVCELCHNK